MIVRRLALGRWAMRSPWGGDWLSHAASMSHGLFQDAVIALWPAHLRACYSFPAGADFWQGAALKAALILAFCGLVLHALRRRMPAGFALFWCAASLIPVSNILPIEALCADRFLYAPLAGSPCCAAGPSALGARAGPSPRAFWPCTWGQGPSSAVGLAGRVQPGLGRVRGGSAGSLHVSRPVRALFQLEDAGPSRGLHGPGARAGFSASSSPGRRHSDGHAAHQGGRPREAIRILSRL